MTPSAAQSSQEASPPRGILLAAVLLIGCTLALVAFVRISRGTASTSIDAAHSAGATAVVSRELRFLDRDDGSVAILAAPGGAVVDVLPPGSNGFVRGVMRGLARDRRARAIDSTPPFRITRWSDGRLSLEDPANDRVIDLGAFGPTNTKAFADILDAASRP